MGVIKKKFIDNELSDEQVKCLKKIDVCLDSKNQILFNKSIELARRAVDNGIIISKGNQLFEGKNLYFWLKETVKRKYEKKELSNEEIEIIEKLTGKPLYKLNNGTFVKVVDVINNKEIAICKSQRKAAKLLKEAFDVNTSLSVVFERVKGKVTTPYKGRFMFYYATDEEVKKYLKDKK